MHEPSQEDLAQGRLHAEWVEVGDDAAQAVADAKAAGGRVIAVGTTVVRTLESCGASMGKAGLEASEGETDIFIYPGFTFHVADALMTNFHLPKSTLMMLVSAVVLVVLRDRWWSR